METWRAVVKTPEGRRAPSNVPVVLMARGETAQIATVNPYIPGWEARAALIEAAPAMRDLLRRLKRLDRHDVWTQVSPEEIAEMDRILAAITDAETRAGDGTWRRALNQGAADLVDETIQRERDEARRAQREDDLSRLGELGP